MILTSLSIGSTDIFGMVSRAEGFLDTPEVRRGSADVPIDGAVPQGLTYYEPRSLVLGGNVVGSSAADLATNWQALKTSLIAAKSDDVQVKFTLAGQAERFYYARLADKLDAPAPLGVYAVEWDCQLICYDPLAYESGAQDTDTDSASPYVVAVTNSGDAPTPATFTIDGPITNPIITHSSAGNFTFSDLVVADGESLVVYYGRGKLTAMLEGVSVLGSLNFIASVPFLLPPLSSTAALTGSADGANTALTVDYRSAWA